MMIAAPPPALSPLKPCYVSVQSAPDTFTSEALPLAGSGFEAGERLTISVDGSVAVTGVTAGTDGSLPLQALTAPTQPSGERAFDVTVTNTEDGTERATASARVSALAVAIKPKSARPQQTVKIAGRGFTGAGPIYAHYVRRNQLRRTVELADAPTGACGRFSVKRPQFPFKPAEGVWRIQIDQHADLETAGPLVNLSVDVRRRPVTRP